MNRKENTILVTIVANLLLVSLKFGLAIWSGSFALRASAWHSMGDVFISLFVLAGLIAGRWEAKRRHRVGLIENIVALVVSGFIFYVAYTIFIEVVLAGEQAGLRNPWLVALTSLLTIAVTYFIARLKNYVGKATNSPSLIASGYHSRMDMYASALVVTSLIASALGLGSLDLIVSLAVILLVLKSGWEIAASAIKALFSGGLLNLEEDNIARVRRHTKRFASIGIGALIIGIFLSGVYAIQPDERGIVRQFGQVVADVGPGLHYRLPLVSRMDRVALDRVRQLQTENTLVLTGDTNLIEVKVGVQYIVSDPNTFLFNVVNSEQLVEQEAESSVRQIVAQRSVDELLTTGRGEINNQAKNLTQALVDEHQAGLKIVNVQLLAVNPPSSVADAFRDVSSAREDRSTYINEAMAYRNEVIPSARGQAVGIIETARAEKTRKIDFAIGEAAGFESQLAAYLVAPGVTRTRLYLETLERVLPSVNKFIIDPTVRTDGTELWLTNPEATK